MNISPSPKQVFGTLALTVFASFSAFSNAAEPDKLVRFTVPGAQITALGIQTVALQTQSDSVRATYPAEVVVPPNADQVISAPVAGLVVQLLVQQNQVVQRGTPLVRIASPEFGQLQLQLLQASSRTALAQQAAQREQQLFAEGIIPQRRVQEAQSSLKENQAALKQARAALLLSGMSNDNMDRIIASGNPMDSVILNAAQSGIVAEINVKAGQRVDSVAPLLRVVQTETLWLDIQVPVADSTSWQPGSKLKVQGRDVTARIISTGSTVAASSQTVMIRALVEGKQLRPGEILTVELPAMPVANSWDIPLSAVAHEDEQAYVFVRTTDGFEARPVRVVASGGQRTRVQGTLKAGEQIAVSGIVALKGAWQKQKESK